MARPKMLPYSEDGRIVGEAHPKARLTNHQVDLIRELREEHRMTYNELALMFSMPKATIAYICRYQRRVTTAMHYRPAKKREGA